MKYSTQNIRELLEAKPEKNVSSPYNHSSTTYAIPEYPNNYWMTCREAVFATAQAEWKKLKKRSSRARFDLLFSVPMMTSGAMADEELRLGALSEKVAKLSNELEKVEKYLHFARHELTFSGKNKPASYQAFCWKINVSSRWRYSPTLFYLLLSMLRGDFTFDQFKTLDEVKAVKEHGVKKIFGSSLFHRLDRGETHQGNHGNVVFRTKHLPEVLRRIKAKESGAKKDKKRASKGA